MMAKAGAQLQQRVDLMSMWMIGTILSAEEVMGKRKAQQIPDLKTVLDSTTLPEEVMAQ